jgi:asparagine synthase (glutamine-hydrolysing)
MDSKMTDMLVDSGSNIYQFLLPSAVRKLFDLHASGRQDNHTILFSLVLFEEWLRAQQEPVAALS